MILPSDYELAAALRVARLIDQSGNEARDLRASYRDALTQGKHVDRALVVGEELLAGAGLIVRQGSLILPTEGLAAFTSMDDGDARSILLAALASIDRRADGQDADHAAVGLAGELAVMEQCRTELIGLHRYDLADGVQQVSLISDSLGYDVLAPTFGAHPRRLEVKTASERGSDSVFRFFISRNEYDVGRRLNTEWSLVACRLVEDSVSIAGWTRASSLHAYLPDDGNGRWTEALVLYPLSGLTPGIPPAI